MHVGTYVMYVTRPHIHNYTRLFQYTDENFDPREVALSERCLLLNGPSVQIIPPKYEVCPPIL